MRGVGDDVVVGMVDGFESMGIRFRFYLFVLLVGGAKRSVLVARLLVLSMGASNITSTIIILSLLTFCRKTISRHRGFREIFLNSF